MPSVGSYGNVGKKVEIEGTDTTATIENISIASGDVNSEQSLALPSNTKQFIMKTRGNGKIQLSYTLGESGTKFITISGMAVYSDDNFYESQTIYFQVDRVDTVEIIAFS